MTLCSRLVQESRKEDFTFNIEEKEAEFREDLRSATGIGRPRKSVSFFLQVINGPC